MYTRIQFLIRFRFIENELIEHYEFAKLKKDKDAKKLIWKCFKVVKEMQNMIREDIDEFNKP